jgi:hypothetical protein
MTPPGYVRLRCDDPALNVVVLLGEDGVLLTAGLGGWDVTARPRQVGMTTWSGAEPLQVTLPLIFDGWARGRAQDTALARLFSVARGDAESEPGLLRVDGIAGSALPNRRWVIESVEYGTPILDPATMRRLRQPVTLTLREFTPPTYMHLRKRALAGTKRKTRVVATRRDETPAKLARRCGCKWTDLRSLNPQLIHKANHPEFKAGVKVRVPVAVQRDHKVKGGRH